MSSWEWYDEVPTAPDVLKKLEELPDVWGVKVADYIDYVLPMTKNQKIETDGVTKHIPVTKLYMQVAGRVKMLEEAARRFGWSVTEKWMTVSLDPVVRQVEISIGTTKWTDEVAEKDVVQVAIGSRFGISKLDAKGWEKMETAARGRALGAWGFGVLPGSGIASYDEMEFVGVEFTEETEEVKKKTRQEVIEDIGSRRTELAQARGVDIEEIDKGLVAYVLRRWNKKIGVDDDGLDLSDMKDGQLVLMHNDLINQLKKAQALEGDKLDG